MKILKILPRHENHINSEKRDHHYNIWNSFMGDEIYFEDWHDDINIKKYDFIFITAINKWISKNKLDLLYYIKNQPIKKILFDNDSCYRDFNEEYYNNIDFIFYRDTDKNGNSPDINSMWLPWSVDIKKYKPVYGGTGIVFNCSISKAYPIRQKISKIIKPTNLIGPKYVKLIQNSAGAIHTDSDIVPMVRAKSLEFASCGTHIISNRVKNMNDFFPDELINYFDSVEELKEMIKDFKPNIEIQKELRNIVEKKHSVDIRKQEILYVLKNI